MVRDPASGSLSIADGVADDDPRLVVHDAHTEDPSYAFALSRLSQLDSRLTPMGIFRDVQRDSYDRLVNAQVEAVRANAPGDDAALADLLRGSDPWTVG